MADIVVGSFTPSVLHGHRDGLGAGMQHSMLDASAPRATLRRIPDLTTGESVQVTADHLQRFAGVRR